MIPLQTNYVQKRYEWLRRLGVDISEYRELIPRLPDLVSFMRSDIAKIARVWADANGHRQLMKVKELYYLMCFESAGCRVISPARDFCEMFKNTDANIPLRDIRAPYPFVLFRLPTGMFSYPLDGKKHRINEVWVRWSKFSEAEIKENAGLGRVVVTHSGGETMWHPPSVVYTHPGIALELLAGTAFLVTPPDNFYKGDYIAEIAVHLPGGLTDHRKIQWDTSKEEIALGYYKRAMDEAFRLKFRITPWESSPEEVFWDELFNLVTNTFYYMSSPEADTRRQPSKRKRLEEVAGMSEDEKAALRQLLAERLPIDEFVIGQEIVIQREQQSDQPNSNGHDSHKSPKTHWRRGHWHRYWTGNGNARVLTPKWIKPALVCGIGLPADGTNIRVRSA